MTAPISTAPHPGTTAAQPTIGDLAVITTDLLMQAIACGIAPPRYFSVSATQRISVQVQPDSAALFALARWAEAFGGTLASNRLRNSPETVYRVEFDYHGTAVEVYTVLSGNHDEGGTDD
jgi:hypothetical protein